MKTQTITNKTNYLFVIALLFFTSSFFGQTTYVPDNNFETYLETHDASGNVVAVGDPTSMGNGIANDDYVFTNRINTVTSLDVSNLSSGITDLTGISDFIALINLNCSNNTIGNLDVSSNIALKVLICNGYSVPFSGDQPAISSLNLGSITSLETLSCSINSLTTLDISNQTNLTSLDCSSGYLTSLNLANQTNLISLDCSSNNLNSLNLSSQTNLQTLRCNYNTIGVLNLSNNTALEIVECAGIYIPSDIINPNATITPNVNTITFSNTNSIKTLNCENNLMTSLSLSSLNSLEILDCSINNLGSLDVSSNTALVKLDCYGYSEGFPIPTINPNISSLNLGNINTLTDLNCSQNGLTNLNVFYLSQLKTLNTSSNSLSTLNLSNNTDLTDVYCRDNNLQILDVKNGNNNAIVDFNATNNTTLICLQVDDAIAANAGTGVYASWQKDASVTYSDDCATYVPDNNFETYLETHDASGNVVAVGDPTSMGNGIANDDYVTTAKISGVTNLNVSNESISDLTGIEDFAALAIFNCSANSLTSIDVSNNNALLVLDCFQNSLTSLDVSNNTALQNLACFQNSLSSLDISQNLNLKTLNCEFNQLTQLNVANGNNINFTYFNASNNSSLSCIQIDTGFTPPIETWFKDATARFSTDCVETYVPDNNFETYLETHDASGNVVTVGDPTSMGNGIANDDYVTTAKINTVILLDVSGVNIFELTGIEDFVALTSLTCYSNNISSLDLSQNINLTKLACANNSITSLNIIQNSALTTLFCNFNSLSNLDITNNPNLVELQVDYNNLSSIDLTNKPLLSKLYITNNQFTSLDVSNHPALTILEVSQNQLTYLDVSNNIQLQDFQCDNNNLTGLSVFDNDNLTKLICSGNQINSLVLPQQTGNLLELEFSNNQVSALDVSAYTQLSTLDCYNNVLTQLNVANGNNINFTYFNASNNSSLSCIQIDNGFTPNTNWFKDATASYSFNCNFNETYVPDNNFETYLETHDASGNVVAVGDPASMGNGIANDDYVTTSAISSVTTLQINNQNISDLTGIEDFIALISLDCEYNQISTVDFSSNTALVTLYCNNNQISNLDLLPNTALQELYCNDNVLTNLQISPGSLVNLYCENNQIPLLDLSNFFNLETVHCYNNAITTLDLLNSAGNLIDLRCNNNQLTGIDVDANINLVVFHCGNNQLTNLVLTTNTALEDLRCDNNQLTGLNVTQNTALQVLLCNNNNMTTIDVTQNIGLTDFFCNNNQLTSLDVSQNTALIELRCQNNQLTDLVTTSTMLQFLNCNDNALANLDVSQSTALADLQCSGNQLGDLDVSANAQLTSFNCSANELTRLIIKNGNNTAISTIGFDATGNANLTCIEVDDVTYTTANWTNIDAQTSFNTNCHYGETYVPDDNFEQALINLGYDIVLDDYVTTANISGVTILDVSSQNISDLTGIEDFTSLVNLNCSANNLTSLDVTNNTALTNLGCGANFLTSIDVQQNIALTELVVSQNQLTGLDVVQNVNLVFLACEGNPFNSGLDITQNTLLQNLIVSSLNLTSLDISQNDDLQTIDCGFNAITALDFTGKQDLTQIRCQFNQLTDVYLRENPMLTLVDVSDNMLTELTIDNGNNTAILGNSFYATSNPNLACIQVDNVTYSTNNWTNIDATASFSTNCATFGLTYVPDNNFENYLETHDAAGNVVALGSATSMGNGIANDDYVTTAKISGVTSLDVSNLSISDLTGIEDFVALTNLICDTNSIINLDVSQNVALDQLWCYGNSITSLDLTQNTALTLLNTSGNSLNALNLSLNTALTYLYCANNSISSLDLTNNASLIELDCNNNQLTSLNVKNGNNNNVILFNATTNPFLTCIEVDDINIPSEPIWLKDATASYSTNCATFVKIWENGAWTNGVPTIANNAIIRDNYSTGLLAANIEAKSLVIDSGYFLTIEGGDYVKVNDNITVNGTLIVEHQGSFVQVNDAATVTKNGTINVNLTTPNLASRDFMIMGSPMTAETRTGVFNSAFLVLNHTTANFVPNAAVAAAFPAAENFADDNYDNWNSYTGIINPAEGYIVRPQSGYGQPGGIFNMTYQLGTLNNGVVNFNVVYNTSKNDSPNVLANPYASALFADDFILENSMIDEVYFWEHLTPPSASLPGAGAMNFSMEDISMYNLLGGTPAASDPGTSTTPNGYIATGQGFGIKATAAGTAVFNNSMRRNTGNNTLRNPIDKDRIWLTVRNNQYEMQNTTLVGFTQASSQDFDNGYDSRRLATVVSLYSHLPDGSMELGIQGREAFNEDSTIPMGFSTLIDEMIEYKISIADIQGANITQADVYLIDNLTGMVTNLNQDSYSFTSGKETYNNRFTLLFKNPVLGNEDSALSQVSLYPNPTSGHITIVSPKSPITQLQITDIHGRVVETLVVDNRNQETISLETLQPAMYFIKIQTQKGSISKRVIKK